MPAGAFSLAHEALSRGLGHRLQARWRGVEDVWPVLRQRERGARRVGVAAAAGAPCDLVPILGPVPMARSHPVAGLALDVPEARPVIGGPEAARAGASPPRATPPLPGLLP